MSFGLYVWATIFAGPFVIVLVDGAIEFFQKSRAA